MYLYILSVSLNINTFSIILSTHLRNLFINKLLLFFFLMDFFNLKFKHDFLDQNRNINNLYTIINCSIGVEGGSYYL